MSFQRLAALMENEDYKTALAIVKALPANTRDMRVLGGKINKIEANILLASTLGSPADFKRLLRNRIIDNKLQPTLDASTASPSSGLADDHISVGLCAKAITPHAAAALKSIGIGCLDISGNSRLVALPATELCTIASLLYLECDGCTSLTTLPQSVAKKGGKRAMIAVHESLCEQLPPSTVTPSLVHKINFERMQKDYAKMVGNSDLADVVLVVEGERFPAHRVMLAARNEYFRGLFLSGMQGGRSKGGLQEIELGGVSVGAFRVVLRYLYTAELPGSGEGEPGAGGGKEEGSRGGGEGEGEGGKGKGEGCKRKRDKDTGGNGEPEEATTLQELERAMLKAADRFRVEGLFEHCVEAFGRGLKVNTAVEQLVWAHNHGPAEARTVATEYFVRNGRRIQVGAMCDRVCV